MNNVGIIEQNYKKCTKCEKEFLSTKEFWGKDKYSKDGLTFSCKICRRKQGAEYYHKNRTDRLNVNKEYILKNKDKRQKYNQDRSKSYREKNKEQIRIKKNIWFKRKYENDGKYRLHKCFSANLRNSLFKNNIIKDKKCFEILEYSLDDLKIHLEKYFESWMNWNNYGIYDINKKTWQIDHVFPQSLLPYDSLEHPNFKKCWALENLRPLSAYENNKKQNKILTQ